MILATDNRYGIGYKNRLPWKFPEDLKFFKESTEGCSVVMGRKTFESLGLKPLPNRKNYVITRSQSYENINNVSIATNIKELVSKYENSMDILFVIGGKKVYEAFAPYTKEILWSKIDGYYKTDVNINKSIFDNFIEGSIQQLSDLVCVSHMIRNTLIL